MKKSSPVMMHIQFDVEISKLGLFTELLENEVHNLEMKQVSDGVFATKLSGKAKLSGMDESKGTCAIGIAFIEKLGKGKEFSTLDDGELGEALAAHGYSKTSASPVTSMLALKGRVKRNGKGKAIVL